MNHRTTPEMIDAFCEALKSHVGDGSPLRIGQLLFNLTARGISNEDYHLRLFNIENEDLQERVQDAWWTKRAAVTPPQETQEDGV